MNLKNISRKILSKIIVTKLVITGVPAIITNSKKEILLGKRSENVIYYPGFWGLPGGLVDKGEKLNQAVKREIKEELGIKKIKIMKQGEPYMKMPTKKCSMQTLNIPIHCKILSKGTPKPKDETSEVKWFKPKEIRKMKLAYGQEKLLKQEGVI